MPTNIRTELIRAGIQIIDWILDKLKRLIDYPTTPESAIVGRTETERGESDRLTRVGDQLLGVEYHAPGDDLDRVMQKLAAAIDEWSPNPALACTESFDTAAIPAVTEESRESLLYHQPISPRGDVDLVEDANSMFCAAYTRPHQEPIAPPGNKAAYSSIGLFAQQNNPRTHNPGLQLLLDVIHRYIQAWEGCETIALTRCRFIINFATPMVGRDKSYSVKISYPIALAQPVEFRREMDEGSLHVRWVVVHNGQSVMIDSHKGLSVPLHEAREIRESRRIEFRDK